MSMTEPVPVPVRLTAKLPFVWRHRCGALNEGSSTESATGAAVCDGCHTDVRADDVAARYLLVEVRV